MHDESAIHDITAPNREASGPGYEWAMDDVLQIVIQYLYGGNDDKHTRDPARTAAEALNLLPVWKLYWNGNEEALDEICRQLRLQLEALSRLVMFVAKQVHHTTQEHIRLAEFYHKMCEIDHAEYMPFRFSTSLELCEQTDYWLSSAPTAMTEPSLAPHLAGATPSSQAQPPHSGLSIWLFDRFLSPIENANLMAFRTRLYCVNPSARPLLGFAMQAIIEAALCYAHSAPFTDLILPGAATWFLYAYPSQARPEDLLHGWYEVYVPPPAASSGRQSPSGQRYTGLTTAEERWWAFFKDKFREARDRTDLKLTTRECADAAVRRMDWLDGSDKVGFWQGLKLRVSATKRRDARL